MRLLKIQCQCSTFCYKIPFGHGPCVFPEKIIVMSQECVQSGLQRGCIHQWEARTGDHWPMRGQESDLIKSLRVIHWDHWPLARLAWEWEKINPNKCVKWENVQLWRLMSFDVFWKLKFYNFSKRQEVVLIKQWETQISWSSHLTSSKYRERKPERENVTFSIRQNLLIAPECHFLFHGPLTFMEEIIEIQIILSQQITTEWRRSEVLRMWDSFLQLEWKGWSCWQNLDSPFH